MVFLRSWGGGAAPLMLCALGLFACKTESETTTSTTTGSGSSTASTGTGSPEVVQCTMPTPVPCSDQVILGMNLQKDISKGAITNTADGSGFTSTIDATAGGAFAAQPTSYTYAKFGADGLDKVSISDEDSLDSMDWDIAFRRYVIRINSGSSGPSCVTAGRVPPDDGAYTDITTPPADVTYAPDNYFTPSPSCMIIPDGTGLPNSPATALASFWTYPGCVAMSNFTFLLQLADGRHVKLVVDDYYTPSIQTKCDQTGQVPMGETGSGNYQIRWEVIQ